jgi:hypothetical protein
MARGGGKSPINISHHLKGVDFPATKDDLIKQAEKNGAEDDVMDVIDNMPDEKFKSMADVMKAYGDVQNHAK